MEDKKTENKGNDPKQANAANANTNTKKQHPGKPIEEQDKAAILGLLDKQKKDHENQTKELIDLLQRLQAEFENYKKRVEKQHNDLCKFANKNMVILLLPLLDSFEIALKNTKNHADFVKGIELVFSQFVALLENEGLKQIQIENQRFNPCFHEALMQEKHEKLEDDQILEEFQKGYMLNDIVIRPSKVKVNKR